MATLLEYLQANGYEKEDKKTTVRDYREPTIEFYKGGQARLRGIDNTKLKYLVYHVNDNGIELFTCENKEEMLSTSKAMNWRTCETSAGDPNIRVGGKAKEFYAYIKEKNPDNNLETRVGGVSWDVVKVDDKKIAWEK